MAWFRVYYLFGEVIPCFWHTDTGAYQHVTMREFYEYKLLPLAEIVFEVADIVRLNFFSTEIALTGEGGDRRFVVIDYVNDQCELCVRPPKMAGPVPEVIDHIAEVFVRMAWVHKIGKKIVMHRTIRLADGQEKRKMRKKAVQFI
jgi:hypothetical protein